MNKLIKCITLSSASVLTVLTFTSCNKSVSKIKNEQIGKVLSSYYDAYARQPEAAEKLNSAKDCLLYYFDHVSTDSQYYALGTLGGAGNPDRYYGLAGDGLFSAIAKQPEIAASLILAGKNAIEYIVEIKNDEKIEMIGLSTSKLIDGLARQPEITQKLMEYSIYINDSISLIDDANKTYSIGYASLGFYDACARQPETADDMWTEFKSYIDSLK